MQTEQTQIEPHTQRANKYSGKHAGMAADTDTNMKNTHTLAYYTRRDMQSNKLQAAI